jgi:hypothetical protein
MTKEEEIIGSYKISKFPKDRIPTLDFLSIGDNKHYVKALIEVDVTEGPQLTYKSKSLNFSIYQLDICFPRFFNRFNKDILINVGFKCLNLK